MARGIRTRIVVRLTVSTLVFFTTVQLQSQTINWMRTKYSVLGGGGATLLSVSTNGTLFSVHGDGEKSKIHKSTDKGTTWILSTTIADNSFQLIKANTKGYIFAKFEKGILKSSDQGNTWQLVGQGLFGFISGNSFALGPGGTIALKDNYALWVSSDYGDHWEKRSNDTESYVLYWAPSGILFRAAASGLEWSPDSGRSWGMQSGVPTSYFGLFGNSQGHIYIFGANSSHYSTDSGNSWLATDSYLSRATLGINTTYGVTLDNEIVAESNKSMYVSSDGGSTWRRRAAAFQGWYVESDGSGGFVGSRNGIWGMGKVDTIWTCVGPPVTSVRSLFALSKGRVIANGWITRDSGMTWDRALPGRPVNCACEDQSGNIYIGSDSSKVFQSSDGGSTWIPTASVIPTYTPGIVLDVKANVMGDLFSIVQYTDQYSNTKSGLYRSTDFGKSWIPAKEGASLRSIAVQGTSVFLAGSSLHKSTNRGLTWIDLPQLPYWNMSWPQGQKAVAGADGAFYVVDYQVNLWKLSNGASDWQFKASPVYDCACNSQGVILTGSNAGIRQSTDGGNSWLPQNAGIEGSTVMKLDIDQSGFAYAGTRDGLFVTSTTTLTKVASDSPFPSLITLLQNFPNPFNPSTTIRYGLPKRSQVSLSVYNTLGQQVAQLVNEEIDAGYHEVEFNGSSLPSGVYFYRIQAGSYVETRRLLLLK